MSSSRYPAHYPHNGRYTEQQMAQLRAQQEQERRQRQAAQAQRSAASYPSPESNSPGSDASSSSPGYTPSSPTLYRSQPSVSSQQKQQQASRPQFEPQSQLQSRSSTYPATSTRDPSFFCLYPEHQSSVAFVRKADMQRHYGQVHNPQVVRTLECPEPDCLRRGDRGFGRKDKLVEHLREVHKVDIPKRTYGERR